MDTKSSISNVYHTLENDCLFIDKDTEESEIDINTDIHIASNCKLIIKLNMRVNGSIILDYDASLIVSGNLDTKDIRMSDKSIVCVYKQARVSSLSMQYDCRLTTDSDLLINSNALLDTNSSLIVEGHASIHELQLVNNCKVYVSKKLTINETMSIGKSSRVIVKSAINSNNILLDIGSSLLGYNNVTSALVNIGEDSSVCINNSLLVKSLIVGNNSSVTANRIIASVSINSNYHTQITAIDTVYTRDSFRLGNKSRLIVGKCLFVEDSLIIGDDSNVKIEGNILTARVLCINASIVTVNTNVYIQERLEMSHKSLLSVAKDLVVLEAINVSSKCSLGVKKNVKTPSMSVMCDSRLHINESLFIQEVPEKTAKAYILSRDSLFKDDERVYLSHETINECNKPNEYIRGLIIGNDAGISVYASASINGCLVLGYKACLGVTGSLEIKGPLCTQAARNDKMTRIKIGKDMYIHTNESHKINSGIDIQGNLKYDVHDYTLETMIHELVKTGTFKIAGKVVPSMGKN